ncbi:hypothetical protein SAMN02745704_02799 [Paucidesulfovibrio gracilis DSM 16080]|uniref:Uncharacterized protein n=1 Tax=Paucidesulfovibrio gracilis DSM 16080 TaxID=1121449 RepID=A0A1T4Y552_9BACT|nr:hypothetical protein [Paucidesulfovibrio gracilis]SKA96954.1 hypothetical protein SAMN02745704_02799 [Paucidesulfovibrio gracilis DSM 16080]
MKKFLVLLIILAAAAVYFGVINIRTGDGEFSLSVDHRRAGEVVDTIKKKAEDIKDVVLDEQ